MSHTQRKPFSVLTDWIEYAHGPAAEDGQPLAKRLCEIIDRHPTFRFAYISEPELVRELISVAELFTPEHGDTMPEEIQRGRRALSVIKRGRKWLEANK